MKKRILLISSGWVHPTWISRHVLLGLLKGEGMFEIERVGSMEELAGREKIQKDAAILYFHRRKISDAAMDAFESFVTLGGGVLAIHSATASFKKSDRYFDILGGRFIGHGPVEPLEIVPSLDQDEIFPGIQPFLVKDELYRHETRSDIRVHFTAECQGESVPVVWTRKAGKGRVCYACPGHRSLAMRSESYRKILLQGVHWICDNNDARGTS